MKIIFCQSCGSKNLKESKACFHCGEKIILKDEVNQNIEFSSFKKLTLIKFVLSSFSSLFCTFLAIYFILNGFENSFDLRFLTPIFLIIASVFAINSIINLISITKLEKINLEKNKDLINGSEGKNARKLNEPDFTDFVPPSVLENTTRNLEKTKIK